MLVYAQIGWLFCQRIVHRAGRWLVARQRTSLAMPPTTAMSAGAAPAGRSASSVTVAGFPPLMCSACKSRAFPAAATKSTGTTSTSAPNVPRACRPRMWKYRRTVSRSPSAIPLRGDDLWVASSNGGSVTRLDAVRPGTEIHPMVASKLGFDLLLERRRGAQGDPHEWSDRTGFQRTFHRTKPHQLSGQNDGEAR